MLLTQTATTHCTYTYPFTWTTWAVKSYGPESMHGIKSLDAAGTVRLGGLWKASDDALDQEYEALLTSIRPETASARDARLHVDGNLTLHATTDFQVVLGAASAAEDWRGFIAGAFTQAGTLTIVDDGTLDVGTYDLFDATSFTGGFALSLPLGWDGSYDASTGVLEIAAVPEPAAVVVLAGGLVALRRRRRAGRPG